MTNGFGHREFPTFPKHSPLDDESAALVAQAASNPTPKWWDQSIAQNRVDYHEMIAQVGLKEQGAAERTLVVVKTRDGHDLPMYVFRPTQTEDALVSTILFLRGSGMCMGDMSLYFGILERVACQSNSLVFAPDYRLAPEHPYPIGHEDAFDAYEWLLEAAPAFGGDANRLVVAGDSAGGMLAASLGLSEARAGRSRIALLALIAPALGITENSFSAGMYKTGFLLDVEDLKWLYATYDAHGRGSDESALYPILAEDLSGMAPTLMITAGSDIMRDDAEAFLKRIHASGSPIELYRMERTIHPFLNMGEIISVCEKSISLLGERISVFFTDPDTDGGII